MFKLVTRPRIRPRHLLLPIAGALILAAVLYWLVAGAQSELPTGPNACTTLGCGEYAKRLHATVNRSANPCQSFTRFVCSGWNHNNPWSVREDYFRLALSRLNRTLHKVKWPSRGQNEEQRAAAVYQSCDDVFQGKTDQLPAVKTALAEAGISVADITATVTHINLTESRWLETLEKLNVSARSPFLLTTQLRYVQAVFGLWEAFGEDSFHVLVSWWTVQIAALYANRDLILNVYYPYPEFADVYHVAFCVGRAAYFSSHAVFARHSREIVKGGVEDVARKLVLTVRRAFLRRLLRWNSADVDVTSITNWTSLSVAFRSFDYLNGTEIVESGPIPGMTRSFVHNWKHSVLIKRTLDSESLLAAIDYLLTQFFVVNEHDSQLLPYALSYPLFDLDLPAAVNYGGLGADVGNGLAVFLLHGLASANSSIRNSFLECMSQTLLTHGLGTWGTWMGYIYQAVMFGALIDAYKESDFGVYLPLPGFEGYNGLQTLFLSQCYTWCGGSHDGAGEFRCDIYLQHVPEFAEAFNCSKGDPMYPGHQCKLF
ncbi:hypothetical protein HPB48_009093 [Haemaphysalis longicornis]|uniref:Peptidase M13 C-terminal domain-containing protein n=1 Tax=Haemaphysalis longicornis TaxID=44386 RepID=A0A9J6FV42_HAELO|nr:hypothetical protein HPB48_009093 [Haemaphysalis longicornis]